METETQTPPKLAQEIAKNLKETVDLANATGAVTVVQKGEQLEVYSTYEDPDMGLAVLLALLKRMGIVNQKKEVE